MFHDLIIILLHIFLICKEKKVKKSKKKVFIYIVITSGVPGIRTPVASDCYGFTPGYHWAEGHDGVSNAQNILFIV